MTRAGNCGHSSNKARNYSASASTTGYSFAISPAAGANGLFPDPTTVQANGPVGGSFTVTVNDGTPETCITTCTVTVTGDGPNVVKIIAPDGTTTVAAIPIDTHPPVVAVTSPAPNARYKTARVVPTSFTCSQRPHHHRMRRSRDARHVDDRRPHGRASSATDQFGLTTTVDVPYYVDGTPPTFAFNITPPTITNAGHGGVQLLGD